MITIHELTSLKEAANYYKVKDEYYSDNPNSHWYGRGAQLMGLEGEVYKSTFEQLLSGRNHKGKVVVKPGVNGEHRLGYDITFGAPKSLSIMLDILGDERLFVAHKQAVEFTLNYLETMYAQARITLNGKTESVNTGNLIIATFDENTNRALEPHRHTHAIILNMTQRKDGKWRALTNEQLYQQYMFLGQIYRSQLAKGVRLLGYEIDVRQKGLWEFKGMPEEVLEEFSKRTKEIVEYLQELRKSHPELSEVELHKRATLDTRQSKKFLNENELRSDWLKQLHELGYSKEKIMELVTGFAHEPEPEGGFNYTEKALELLTENESVVTSEQIFEAALMLSIGKKTIEDIKKEFTESREVRTLAPNRFTTREMLAIEAEIVDKILAGKGIYPQLMEYFDAELYSSYNFTHDQLKALEFILTNEHGVVAIQGDAGSGKTYMLGIAAKEAEHAGFEVLGLAPTGKGVKELKKEGIKSKTIDSYLRIGEESSQKRLIIIDESSMLGSKKLKQVLDTLNPDDRLLLTGDRKQLQSIEAGAIFYKLQEHKIVNTLQITQNVRQQTELTKEAVKYVSEKDINRTFLKLADHIYAVGDVVERTDKVTQKYLAQPDSLVIVKSNAERKRINESIRARLIKNKSLQFTTLQPYNVSALNKTNSHIYAVDDKIYIAADAERLQTGMTGRVKSVDHHNNTITAELNGEKIEVELSKSGNVLRLYKEEEREFAKGDKVVFLQNDSGLGVQNGLTGAIEKINSKGEMRIALGPAQKVELNIADYPYLDYGYAVTEYKAQGQTVSNVIYIADTRNINNYQNFYVAITRAKEDIHIYTNNVIDLLDQVKQELVKTSTLDYQPKLTNELGFQMQA